MQQALQAQRQEMFGGWREQRREAKFMRIQLRHDFLGEARDKRILAPFRALCQRLHRRAGFAALADALERLVLTVFKQSVEARRKRRIVEQIAAEDAEQARLGDE